MQNACEVGWPGGTEAKKEGGQITRKGDRHPTPLRLARSLVHFTAENSWGRSMDGRDMHGPGQETMHR